MRSIRRRLATIAALLPVAATIAITASPFAGADSAQPPWEAGDTASVGGLTFYAANGTPITGGNINDQPMAAYVEGATTIRSGDTTATLFAYQPSSDSHGKSNPVGEWSGMELSSSTNYPNAGAPGALASATLPVVTGSSNDVSLEQFAAAYPLTAYTGYNGVLQLRLVTSVAGKPETTSFDSADIQITGNQWSVYSGSSSSATTTKTALSVSKSGTVSRGTAVTLKATVSPRGAAGKVSFRDGTKSLKTVTVSGGAATYTTTSLAPGKHNFSASFQPKDPTAFAASSSAAKHLTVAAGKTSTSLKASKSSVRKGSSVILTATVKPSTAAGSVEFFDGKKRLATVKLHKGTATYSTKTLTVGTNTLTAQYVPSRGQNGGGSTSKTIKVKVTK